MRLFGEVSFSQLSISTMHQRPAKGFGEGWNLGSADICDELGQPRQIVCGGSAPRLS
jgi:hypothetical protein